MSLISFIALFTGILGVWLTIKENVFCWPASILSVVASAYEFYKANLFGDMGLQVFYFFSALYGWYFWRKKTGKVFIVSKTPKKRFPLLITISIAQTIVLFFILTYLRGDRVLIDAILTALSLTATFMMTKKWIENWLAWVFIDISYVVLYSLKFMWLFAILYLFFAIMAFYGWIKWKKTLLK
jgi:nicotinamide mononucleotide transporter